jgi:pilus assembly protein Flp/PilA
MLPTLYRQAAHFLRDEDGPTAVEYGIMMALIIVVCFATIAIISTSPNNTFSYTGQKVGRTSAS